MVYHLCCGLFYTISLTLQKKRSWKNIKSLSTSVRAFLNECNCCWVLFFFSWRICNLCTRILLWTNTWRINLKVFSFKLTNLFSLFNKRHLNRSWKLYWFNLQMLHSSSFQLFVSCNYRFLKLDHISSSLVPVNSYFCRLQIIIENY